jgi:hypothetical protein
MAGHQQKLLSIGENVKVIREIENGKSEVDVCWEFGLINSTIQMIWKNT